MTLQTENIRIIPLGGVGEVGKNMYVVEVQDQLFILDAGIMLPETEMFGIDIVIPDMNYIIENQDRVKAILLSHGHEDHIGALPYLLRHVKAPVYGTKLTIAYAKTLVKEIGVKGTVKFFEINNQKTLKFDDVSVSFFRTNHTIPDSVGICIHTSLGTVVYTGDFKFDQSASKWYRSDLGKMAQIGQKGVLCLLSDSMQAETPGYTTSDSYLYKELSHSMQVSDGRIVAGCYSSDLIRIQQVLGAAAENNRRVIITGKNVKSNLDLAISLGYIQLEEECLIDSSEINDYADHELVFLVTGSHGDLFETLQKMATGQNRTLQIQANDTVLLSTHVPMGGEVFLFKTMDVLSRAGATVRSSHKLLHGDGHGSQEDLKLMLNLMKPKFFIPIRGEFKSLFAHANLARELGVESENIVIPDRGDVIELSENGIEQADKVTAGNVLIDGSGVGDIGNIVLRDRKLLSQDGIFIVVVTINKTKRSIVSGPEIISRGFVYVRESERLMEDSTAKVKEIVEKILQDSGSIDWALLKQNIRDQLHFYLFEQTKRRPMILPIIMEI
ncbi:ribonuclease J [Bacillus oleivorans]|uniref:Ribonuclease J n=1 Tax=Bacillus oleivorans TaxID=1448271 RepID=A0A285D826_9BACI|nr:ribonuclease J [Bacillus oleivorans]SNX75353.1 ribonuclease J [Bacillus oleivorans]